MSSMVFYEPTGNICGQKKESNKFVLHQSSEKIMIPTNGITSMPWRVEDILHEID